MDSAEVQYKIFLFSTSVLNDLYIKKKKKDRFICTTEISLLILINMNCKTWPIVDLELNPQNVYSMSKCPGIPDYLPKCTLPFARRSKVESVFTASTMIPKEKEEGSELKISQMYDPQMYLADY